jgi:hypothetical protein
MPLVGAMAIAAAIFVFNIVVLAKGFHSSDWLILMLLILAVGFASAVPPLVSAICGHKWIASPDGLEFIGRQITQVVHLKCPRSTMAGLRVASFPVKNGIFKKRALALIQKDGSAILLGYGSAAELSFQCDAFRDALALPDDPLCESAYPPPPFWSRLRRYVLPDGVVVVFNPPKIGAGGLLLVAVTVASVGAGYQWVQQTNRALVMPNLFSAYGLLLALAISAGLSSLFLHLKFRYRRAVAITWQAGALRLTERSLFSPCNICWAGPEIDDVSVDAGVATKLASLSLRLNDGAAVHLLANVSRRDAEMASAFIRTAFERNP